MYNLIKKHSGILIVLLLILGTIGAAFIKNNTREYKDITNQDFFIKNKDELEDILASGRPSLITYGSEACPPCVVLKRDLLELKTVYNDVNIYYIEVTETPELIKEYDIQMTPSVLLFNSKGNPYSGIQSKSKKNGVTLYTHKAGLKTDHIAIQYIPTKEDLINVLDIIKGDS